MTFVETVKPKEGVDFLSGIDPDRLTLVNVGDTWKARNPETKNIVNLVSEDEALVGLLNMLERGIQTSRPAFDGVVMLSHDLEHVPMLLKTIKLKGLTERFEKLVKGIGDLCTYLDACHSNKFKNDLDLESVSKTVFGEPVAKENWCDTRSMAVFRTLEKLLGSDPKFANFFSTFTSPLDSRKVRRLATTRTIAERLELCLPLKQYLSEQLAAQQVF